VAKICDFVIMQLEIIFLGSEIGTNLVLLLLI
jgi:hypothetical protein